MENHLNILNYEQMQKVTNLWIHQLGKKKKKRKINVMNMVQADFKQTLGRNSIKMPQLFIVALKNKDAH